MRVVLHPEADAELTEAVAYYAAIDPTLGQRFYIEMERLIREIAAHPGTFRQFDPPVRRHFSRWFPLRNHLPRGAGTALGGGRHASQTPSRLLENTNSDGGLTSKPLDNFTKTGV